MTAAYPTADVVRTIDGTPLKIKLRRADRMHKIRSVGLIMPLFLFLMVSFIMPIGIMLARSVQNADFPRIMPQTAALMQQWDGEGLPGEDALVAFITDLREAKKAKSHGRLGKRLNYDISGFRSLILKTARKVPPPDTPPGEIIDKLVKIDKRWGKNEYWRGIKKASPAFTPFYLLASLDRQIDVQGDIVTVPEKKAVYVNVLGRTFWISVIVTLVCFVLGYPIAFLLGTLPTRQSNLLMILVLLPFWTSLLVRTTAWVVLLQTEGVVNDAAVALGLWTDRIQLIHNRFGVYIAMVHILLPFMVLPLFSVMKGISPTHMRAAASLGANPLRSFIKVYLPQTVPGIGAGVLLVFIISLGYYITPALVGGPKDQMLSFFIALNTNVLVNWGMAAALSVVLLSCVLVFFAMYNRVVGLDKMKIG